MFEEERGVQVSPVKYTFDTPFGEEGRQRAEEHRLRIEQAREEGRQQGIEEGREQVRGEMEAQIAALLERVLAACASLGEQRAELQAREDRRAARVAHLVASRLAPALMKRHPLAEIEALVAECLDGCRRESRIVVRTAEEAVEPLKARLEPLKAAGSFSGQIVLLGDPNIAAGDCRVEWADGGAERDSQALEARIDEAVDRFAGDAEEAGDSDAVPAAVAQSSAAVL